MSGDLWIGSYIVLSATVVWLMLAVLVLYRERLVRQHGDPWPGRFLRPGEPLAVSGVEQYDRAVVLVAQMVDPSAHYGAVAARALADSFVCSLRVVLFKNGGEAPPAWLGRCDGELRASIVVAEGAEHPSTAMYTVLITDGVIAHAVSGEQTPAQLHERFWVFSELDKTGDIQTEQVTNARVQA